MPLFKSAVFTLLTLQNGIKKRVDCSTRTLIISQEIG